MVMSEIIPIKNLETRLPDICTRLAQGDCMALPTETVYGLAGDATNGTAVANIFKTKQRPQFNPLICHVCDMEMAQTFAEFSPLAQKLADTFWPGPLTLVLLLKEGSAIHPLTVAGLDSVGVRCPKGPAGDIIREFGKPLAAPSANRSGKVSPTNVSHIVEAFPEKELLIVDAGSCTVGLESTIVKPTDSGLVILRPGSITVEMIETATGILPTQTDQNASIEAPGMMKSHYAPEAKIALNQTTCPPNSNLMAFGDATNRDRAACLNTFNLSETGNLAEAAANLYHAMVVLDDGIAKSIAVEPIPNSGLGIAINDRLARAAAPRHESEGETK